MQVSSTENSSCIRRERVVPRERKNLCKTVNILYYQQDNLDLLHSPGHGKQQSLLSVARLV